MPLRIFIPHDRIVAFCEKHHLVEFSLFGSLLRDDFGPDSDVDVMVEFAPSALVTFFDLSRMERELGFIFGRRVQIVTRRGVEASGNSLRRQIILNSCELLHAA